MYTSFYARDIIIIYVALQGTSQRCNKVATVTACAIV